MDRRALQRPGRFQLSDNAIHGDAVIHGDALLNDVYNSIKRFCVLPGEHEYTAVTLWCAYTHVADVFHYAPRLIARSPHKRCGKTRLYEIVAELVRSPLRSTSATTSYIFRSLDANPRQTLMLDEVDAASGTTGKAAQNEDLRALLNAGYQRGGKVGRTSGPSHTPTDYETFAPAFLSGIGRMPDTVEDRAVVIQMRRKAPNEHVHPYRPGRDCAALHAVRDRLSSWAEANAAEAYVYANEQQLELPVDDRAADVWEPLIVVACLAGGDWPARAWAACTELVARSAGNDTETSLGQQLLGDIRTVMQADFMASVDLCDALNALPDSPWGDIPLNPHKLGKRLQEYQIRTRHTADKSRRTYCRRDFEDAWRRYLPPESSETVPTVREPAHQQQSRDNVIEEKFDPSKSSDRINRSAPTPDALDTSGRIASDAAAAAPAKSNGECPDCGSAYGKTRKCVACIAQRHNAQAAQAAKQTA
jgi:hypothetical protein